MLVSIIRQIRAFLVKWFWVKPTEKVPEKKAHVMATEVIQEYTIVEYHGQKIALRKSEINRWNSSPRKKKREIAHEFEMMEKKGRIKFVEIDGQMTAVLNRDYEARARKNNG